MQETLKVEDRRDVDILGRAKRLSQVQSLEEVTALSKALFPGSHCPLFGAMLLIQRIQGAACLIVGTDECTYYAKSAAMSAGRLGKMAESCYSLVLSQTDISFGSGEKLKQAVQEILQEDGIRILFVISTCLVELIGDDFDSLCQALEEETGAKIPVVHTEHFRSENHLQGMEATLLACLSLMEETERTLSVNILGPRLEDFPKSELAECLQTIGLPISLTLPSEAGLEEIRKAPQASLNLVTDRIGLPLARAMRDRFKIPYLYFDRFVHPETIERAYRSLFQSILKEKTRRQMEGWLKEKKEAFEEVYDRVREKIKGYSYIYGNSPLLQMELNAYLCELGMEPKLIQLSQWGEGDDKNREKILEYADPYLSKNANISPLQAVYDQLQPDFYFGHEFFERLLQKGIVQAAMDRLGRSYGFQLSVDLLCFLEDCIDLRKKYFGGKHGGY